MENILMRFFLDDKLVLETTSDKHDFLKDIELDLGDVINIGNDKVMILDIVENYPHNIIDYKVKLLE